ncbi:DUF2975 domain-containing protein [Arthrobacter sp. UKPF54-2]|uniref:DUF2975 domain-containing protein n=1 Tax=Arthrobacter sp. UKPF54-2 TaxID=2600159 RepID=UPI0011B17404|nr:DUF2975 domain-containing protein [Arthrobacter sp. UKPF54-2]QDY91068.1 DUF2975 domain-containing protein [Arthrobacter sp. UKPF54-2]
MLGRRSASAALAALLLLVLLSVVVQAWVLPAAVERAVTLFPEVRPLTVPAIVWGVCSIACWQAIAVIAVQLLRRRRDGRSGIAPGKLLAAAGGCLAAFVALVVAAFVALNRLGHTPPGVMLGLLAAGFTALITLGTLAFLAGNPALPSV